MIKEGDIFPNHKVVVIGRNDFNEIETDQLFSGKKIVLFAVPGAFTPTCNNSHLPSFIEKYDEIKSKGIDKATGGTLTLFFVVIKKFYYGVEGVP